MLYTIYTSDEAGNIVERVSLDCISDFNESYKLTVANNVVENGTSIADNTTYSNDEFSISGIVSDYSFRRKDKLITFQNGEFNLIEANDQFVDTSIMDSPSLEIKRKLKEFHKRSEILGILVSNKEYNGSIDNDIEKIYPVIMTSLSFKDTANSVDAIFPTMNFELIRFAETTYSKETNIPNQLTPLTKAASDTGSNVKGTETSVSGDAVGFDESEANNLTRAVVGESGNKSNIAMATQELRKDNQALADQITAIRSEADSVRAGTSGIPYRNAQ